MEDKEKIYDDEICPLMGQIVKICQEKKVDIFTSFLLKSNEEDYMTCDTGFAYEQKQRVDILTAITRCFDERGIFNIDKFLFFLIKNYDCKESIFLNKHNKDDIKDEI